MTIYKLERESTSWQVINSLHVVHGGISSLVTILRDTSRTVTTVDIINARNSWSNVYTQLNNFNTSYGDWFTTSWGSIIPDYVKALTGTLTSLQNINDVINQFLRQWYWDEETNKPIISDISQEHREQLAGYIEQELE